MRQTRSFEHTPESVPEARHFARELARGSAADVVDAIELMVSELVTNCIRHTDSGFDLTIALSPEQIRVEVTDRGLGAPGMRSPRPSDPTGRGLRIVDMLATRWGHEKRPGGGNTVWFTLTLEAESSTAGAAARAQPAREEPISRRRTAARRRPGQPASRARGRTRIREACRIRCRAIRPPVPTPELGAKPRPATRGWIARVGRPSVPRVAGSRRLVEYVCADREAGPVLVGSGSRRHQVSRHLRQTRAVESRPGASWRVANGVRCRAGGDGAPVGRSLGLTLPVLPQMPQGAHYVIDSALARLVLFQGKEREVTTSPPVHGRPASPSGDGPQLNARRGDRATRPGTAVPSLRCPDANPPRVTSAAGRTRIPVAKPPSARESVIFLVPAAKPPAR